MSLGTACGPGKVKLLESCFRPSSRVDGGGGAGEGRRLIRCSSVKTGGGGLVGTDAGGASSATGMTALSVIDDRSICGERGARGMAGKGILPVG
jgi:hypothetical protein